VSAITRELFQVNGVPVRMHEDGSVSWIAGMAIDGDGAYKAYHPGNVGLDHIDNARDGRGGWCGIITRDGDPVIQGKGDPAPGYFVSPTAYRWKSRKETDPRAYVDSESVPFVVVPPMVRLQLRGVVLGCKATVRNISCERTVVAVVADIGPRRKIGEASIACARAVGVPSSPRHGGMQSKSIEYRIWPGIPAIVNGVEYELQRA
jgi:hypothetical protein